MKRVWIPVFVLTALVFFPEVGHACAVCFDASDANRNAFLATTAFLSLLPLGMVGGAGLWMRKRSKEIDREMAEREVAEREVGEQE